MTLHRVFVASYQHRDHARAARPRIESSDCAYAGRAQSVHRSSTSTP